MDFKELNLTQMDKNLTEKEREEWQAIYASYRGGSVLSGKAMGIEEHEISVVPEGKKRAVKESIRCLIVINYRVKVIIPETEVFNDGAEMGQHVLQSMNGAELEYIITHIDREAGFAIGSRKQALTQIRRVNARRRLAENQIIDVKVISVGRGVCTVTYRGFDSVIAQRDISYTAVPDLREVIHPGDVKKAMVKEVNKTEGILNARMAFDKETLRPTYQMIIGEAGESCAFYIADRLGMPNDMLRVAIRAAYENTTLSI
mgnify:CR=1 FL=1